MNSVVESLNLWGSQAANVAWPLFWQSSLLMVVVFALDLVLRHKLRAAVRYALWLVILLKLLIPPSFALPTSPTWWLLPKATTWERNTQSPQQRLHLISDSAVRVSETIFKPQFSPPLLLAPRNHLSIGGWVFMSSASVSILLLSWMLF